MNKVIQFLREAYAELIRVTWPSREQTTQYSILVVLISLATAAFLGILDYFFGIGIKEYLVGTPSVPEAPQIEGLPEGVTVEVDSNASEGAVEISEEVAADEVVEATEETVSEEVPE